MHRFISLFGLLVMVGIAFLLSDERKRVNWRTVLSGIALQLLLGLLILKTSWGQALFEGARSFFTGILAYTNEGSKFIFGSLMEVNKFGFIFFVMVLPTIIFMSSLMLSLIHI